MQIEVSPENYGMITSLASETRLKMLSLLSETPMNISDLAHAVKITPTMAVKHIKMLEKAGIVTCEVQPGHPGLPEAVPDGG